MIVSPSRLEDVRARGLMLDAMETLLRLGRVDDAKEIGVSSAALKKKMDTYDYSQEDRLYRLTK